MRTTTILAAICSLLAGTNAACVDNCEPEPLCGIVVCTETVGSQTFNTYFCCANPGELASPFGTQQCSACNKPSEEVQNDIASLVAQAFEEALAAGY
ncbi:hypothetical protein LTR56_014579 [Elasticomyces elasticus]|nr:hypothetical protein LTR56_014579 [Elasticomyces elasticus]KAK3646789.1 hypothetical protein LTR22_014165 [Elasticomyces elasticus]KAK4916368.1 hypothetical protein LTR49_015602 [Elasticomyces elasticus]KAK5755840.1 hypothetical protein LTS12_014071 [Elasticomyces elasticus]